MTREEIDALLALTETELERVSGFWVVIRWAESGELSFYKRIPYCAFTAPIEDAYDALGRHLESGEFVLC